ncbi:MAG TPA: peptidoglycan-binding domain-containing protein [Chroococcales cyanobacterium]
MTRIAMGVDNYAALARPSRPMLRDGASGESVKKLQQSLRNAGFDPGEIDGDFGANTEKAVRQFQQSKGLDVDGVVGPLTWKQLGGKVAAQPSSGEIGSQGRQQMKNLLQAAERESAGLRPQGTCYAAVWGMIEKAGYGNMPGATPPDSLSAYACQFAEWADSNLQAAGLRKLPISDPYQAPAGSIVVVRAGTPGTAHPTAGDIVVAMGDGRFLNDGEMGYGGSDNFPPGNDYVLGIYAPC